tara:strand:- start:7838 stop:9730 length:1893 start_codon:yes stop_codon:yes gene_type:complete
MMGMFTLLPEAISIRTPEQAQAVIDEYANAKLVAFDTETTGLSRTRDCAVILAISDGKSRYAIYPEVIPYFKSFLENPETKLIAHNANFDQWMLLNVGIDLNRYSLRSHYRIYDTMVMHALVNDTLGHDLKSLAKSYVGIDMVPFKSVFGSQMRKRTLHDLLLDPENEEVVTNYASLDAYATYKLFAALHDELLQMSTGNELYPTLWDYYFKTELPFTKILWEMERTGVRIDKDALLEQAPKIEAELLSIQKWFGRTMGKLYANLNSTKEMGVFFFQELGHKPVSHTEKGTPQLNAASLQKWERGGCKYAAKLLRYRDLDKKLSTYITNLLDRIHTDNRIHATFNQTGARTGRLSSSEPNLQNQPPYIRSAYTCSNMTKLFAADYAQLEMRILAHFSGDPSLITAIKSGQDVHSSTASKMFKVSYDDIMAARKKDDGGEPLTDYDMRLLNNRKGAKAINFGLMYGQGSGRLSATLGCSIDEAKMLIRQYFNTFPNITKYFKNAIKEAAGLEYCTTILGRRRQVPGLNSNINVDRGNAERQVKNSPIQGTAADITRLAMIRLWEDPLIEASGAKMVIQVHDEIVFEVPEEFVTDKDFNDRVKELMMHPFDFDLAVPLETSSKYGANWLECK